MQVSVFELSPLCKPMRGETIATIVCGVPHPGISDGGLGVIDNSRTVGSVAYRSVDDFRNGGPLLRFGFRGEQDPEILLYRAQSQIGTPYDLFFFNCRDFVRSVEGREWVTLMEKAGIAAAATFGAHYFCSRKRGLSALT